MSHTIRILPVALCLGATVCGTTSTASREPAPAASMQTASADSQTDATAVTEADAEATQTEATPGTPSDAASSTSAAAAAPPDPGLVMLVSNDGFQKTVRRARSAILKRKLKLVSQVDHHKNAQTVKMKIPPARTFIFGNAKVGTQLIEAQPSVAIDLPMKLVVWQDGDGKVHIAYNDPQWLVRRHKLSGQDEAIADMKTTLDEIATAAVGEEKKPEEKEEAKGKKGEKGGKKAGADKASAKSGGDKGGKKGGANKPAAKSGADKGSKKPEAAAAKKADKEG